MENKFKRFLSLMLALVMVIGLIPVGHAHAEGNAINLIEGETYSFEIDGDYSNVTGNEIVSVDANYVAQMTDRVAALDTDGIDSGAKYILVNTRLWKALENTTSGNNRLFCRETVANAPVWIVTSKDGDNYTVQTEDGAYMVINSDGTTGTTEAEQVLEIKIVEGQNYWTLKQNGQYLCDFNNNNGNSAIDAGGYSAYDDNGNKWLFYKVSDAQAYSFTLANNGEKVSALESGKQYVFEQTTSNKLLSNQWNDKGGGSVGTGAFLKLNGTKDSFTSLNVWTVTSTGTDGIYRVTDANGLHLRVNNGRADVTNEVTDIRINVGDTCQIGQVRGDTTWYLNRWGGNYLNSAAIGGWSDVNDASSQWNIYEVIKTALGKTAITFTALKAGTTEITIGGTTYIVNVTAAHEHTADEAVVENEVAATCEKDGSYDSVVYCSDCGEVMTRETITVPAAHTPGAAADCENAQTCTVCGVELDAAQGHEPKAEAVIENEVAATCGKDGSYDSVVYCSVCDAEISRETKAVPATGEHTAAEAVTENETAATCGAAGSYDSVVYCSVCDAEISRETKAVPATGEHTYDNDTDVECNVCGETRDAAEHAELSTNIGDTQFFVGETQEFTFTTTANGDAGTMVVGVFTFSDPDAIEKLEYLESKNGQWYELNGAFGPETGFPMIDGTSTFRVTFAKAGNYSVTVDMKVVATGEVLCSITKDVAVAKHAELTTNIDELEFIVGVAQEFEFSTVANGDVGTLVVGASNFSDPSAIAKLEYYEPNYGIWVDLNDPDGEFGSSEGFPMADATSKFRVTFAKAGEYTFTSVVKTVDGDVELCAVEATAAVRDYEHAELTTNIGELEFIVGVAQEFTFSTTAGDDAGTMVVGLSNFSDPDAIEKLEYYEPNTDTWYELNGEFGGANGFPMADATSKFRVTFAKAGEYTFTSVVKTVDGDVELCAVEATAAVRDYEHAELTTNIGELEFIVGVAQEFTFSTTAGDDAGTMVVGLSNFSDPDAIEKLEYYEPNTDTWYELNGEFGGANGFPMADATSKFRVTFAKAGEYTFTSVVKTVDGDVELCAVEATAVVVEPIAPNDPWGKGKWVRVEVDSETIWNSTEGIFEYAWDGNLNTIWHSNWKGPQDVLTGENTISGTIDFTKEYYINQFSFTPRQDYTYWENGSGVVLQASLYVKDADDAEWKCVGEHVVFEHNQQKKTFYFPEQNVRYVKFVAEKASQMGMSDSNGPMGYVAVSEFDIDYVVCEHTNTEIRNAVAATCTVDGYTGDTYCALCNTLVEEGEVITAVGSHTPADAVVENEVEATCTVDGSYDSVVYCSVCNEEISRETTTVPSLGHDFVNGDCSRCDAEMDPPFEDVPVGEFYFDPVYWAVEKGITTGTDETHFTPAGFCQRAAVVTFLWRAAGSPEPTSDNNPFTDVNEGDFFYEAVLWAVEKGITNGTSLTEFSPYQECNRAQVVTFLWRAQGEPASEAEVTFTDVEDGQFYTTAVAWAVEKGVTNGMGDGTFGITVTCNRAQVVTFLYRTELN